MIKYSAEDIIKRAEQLADLENSDFISNYEKLALLNESFQILYQKIINTNDKTWIKQKPVYDGMPLPEDFYQLSKIYVKRTKEQLNKTNGYLNYGYELLGNQIFLTRDCHDLEIIMEYYPVPPSIRLPSTPEETNLYTTSWKDLSIKQEDYKFDIYSRGELITTTTVGNFFRGNYSQFDNGYLIWCIQDGGAKSYIGKTRDGSNTLLSTNEFPVVINNKIYLYKYETKEIIDVNNGSVVIGSASFVVNPDIMIIYSFNNHYVTISDRVNSVIASYDGTEFETKFPITNLQCHIEDNELYLTNNTYVVKIDSTGITTINLKEERTPVYINSPKQITIADNENTEPTYYTISIDDVIYPVEEVLDYPNNLFYVVLSYMLAIAFKNKQSADTTAITAMYESAITQFFDSISRDASSYYKIRNDYGRNFNYR